MRRVPLPKGVRRDVRGFYRFNCAICQARKRIWYVTRPIKPDLCPGCFDVATTADRRRLEVTARDLVKQAKAAKAKGKPVRSRILARRAKAAVGFLRDFK